MSSSASPDGASGPAPRRPLVAGNWKMNGDRVLARRLADAALSAARAAPDVDVAVFPPYPLLPFVAEALGSPAGPVALGGQACHPDAVGAHTAGVSASMLIETGCTFVLCGHSEMRRESAQDDEGVRGSAAAALAAGLRPIVCVGETQAERDGGFARAVLERQVSAVIGRLPRGGDGLDIAYEPVWAIGTGRTATPEQAREAHGWVRALLDRANGERARILYGGSVHPANIGGFLSVPGVDGVLVGGQSLDPAAFTSLVEAARDAAARNPAARNTAARRRS